MGKKDELGLPVVVALGYAIEALEELSDATGFEYIEDTFSLQEMRTQT